MQWILGSIETNVNIWRFGKLGMTEIHQPKCRLMLILSFLVIHMFYELKNTGESRGLKGPNLFVLRNISNLAGLTTETLLIMKLLMSHLTSLSKSWSAYSLQENQHKKKLQEGSFSTWDQGFKSICGEKREELSTNTTRVSESLKCFHGAFRSLCDKKPLQTGYHQTLCRFMFARQHAHKR